MSGIADHHARKVSWSVPASRAERSAHIWEKQVFFKYSNVKPSQVVSVIFIATEWLFQLKKLLKFFSTSAGGS